MIRTDRKTDCPILDRLEKRYSSPHWIFLRELRNDTGFQSTRACDALAVGIYHSRGQLLIGFEKKISRADWLRELKEPEKAEAIAQFCDQWYVVVPDAAIVQLDEIPPTWGLLHVKGNAIHNLRQAPTLTPRSIDRGMLAAIVERAIEQAVKPYRISVEEKDEQEYSRGFEAGAKSASRELADLHDLERQVKEFEASSGIHINCWSHGRELGEQIKSLSQRDQRIRDAVRVAEAAAREMRDRTLPALDGFLLTLGRNPVEPISGDGL